VITSGGILGTIERVYEDDKIDLEIAENVIIKVVRSTIQQHEIIKSNVKK
jgi:preprotein translocase subunit YajC